MVHSSITRTTIVTCISSAHLHFHTFVASLSSQPTYSYYYFIHYKIQASSTQLTFRLHIRANQDRSTTSTGNDMVWPF